MAPIKHSAFSTHAMARMALCAALIAACAWLSIPAVVPFTLQTFGVFCTAGFLGGRRGTIAVAVYLLLGLVGLPVFAGFSAGAGALFGASGGYLLGFLLLPPAYALITGRLGTGPAAMALGMLAGLLAVYAAGTLWFMAVYTRTTGPVALTTVLGWCVLPFILPDLAKMAAAILLVRRLARYVRR